MLPLYLLTNAKGQEMVIELKNGEAIVGQLTNVDNWMNLTLANVTHTSASDSVKLREIYVRGNFIKSIKLQEDAIEKVKQSNAQQQAQGHHQNRDFRRRQGGRRDGEKRFNAGNNNRRGDGRDFNNGVGRRFNNNNNNNSRGGEERRDGPGNGNAMGGFVRHHQTSSQPPSSIGGQSI
ncbi:LADA_0H09340g1_1 [Lachancea dasiensis]|uniref:LSM complex subunit LSM4 n=1 Tax=Lachancea dasiensis TaxID=1072105 RepID=A0A1G4K2R3_9SACH|nr:LADA_0H09340g1_1 [Lachancea dasiensis]